MLLHKSFGSQPVMLGFKLVLQYFRIKRVVLVYPSYLFGFEALGMEVSMCQTSSLH